MWYFDGIYIMAGDIVSQMLMIKTRFWRIIKRWFNKKTHWFRALPQAKLWRLSITPGWIFPIQILNVDSCFGGKWTQSFLIPGPLEEDATSAFGSSEWRFTRANEIQLKGHQWIHKSLFLSLPNHSVRVWDLCLPWLPEKFDESDSNHDRTGKVVAGRSSKMNLVRFE